MPLDMERDGPAMLLETDELGYSVSYVVEINMEGVWSGILRRPRLAMISKTQP